VYLSTYTDEGKRAWRARLCTPHFDECFAKLESCTTDWEKPVLDEPICCPVCRRLEADGYLVATFFHGDGPTKRAGCVCPSHVDTVLEAVGISQELAESRDDVQSVQPSLYRGM